MERESTTLAMSLPAGMTDGSHPDIDMRDASPSTFPGDEEVEVPSRSPSQSPTPEPAIRTPPPALHLSSSLPVVKTTAADTLRSRSPLPPPFVTASPPSTNALKPALPSSTSISMTYPPPPPSLVQPGPSIPPSIAPPTPGTEAALESLSPQLTRQSGPYAQKPGWFKGITVGICCVTQLLAQAQFGMVIIPLTEIGRQLGTADPGELSWMAASYGLTVGMFLVASGRLGDLYGPRLIWMIGMAVQLICNIASGFCKTRIPFDICRALAGTGVALSLPNAVAIIGRTYPPGRMRSLAFSILGALAPAGFVVGGIIAAGFAVRVSVPWIWFAVAIFCSLLLSVGFVFLPPDDLPFLPPFLSTFDLPGCLLLSTALGLFNFTWNQAPLVGWPTSYVWALLLVSLVTFAAFYLWERHVGNKALIPTQTLKKESLLVYLSLWLGWMSFGVFLFYTTLFLRNAKGGNPTAITIAVQFLPAAPGGMIAALLVPTLLTRLPGHVIFSAAMLCFFVSNIMASFNPPWLTYWALTFPSIFIGVFGPDLSFATGQLIVSNSVDREFQGIAGGLVSMITNYSMSIGLGMAGTVEHYAAHPTAEPDSILRGYRTALWFGTALAGVAVVVVGLFVRVPKMAHYRE